MLELDPLEPLEPLEPLDPLDPLDPLEVALGGIEVLLKLKVTSPDLPFWPLDCIDPLYEVFGDNPDNVNSARDSAGK